MRTKIITLDIPHQKEHIMQTSRISRLFTWTAGTLVGAICIQVALVACSQGTPGATPDAGPLATLVDAVANLMDSKPAKAGQVGTFTQIEVYELACDQTYSAGGATGTYGSQEFSGATAKDLEARIVSAHEVISPETDFVPGYTSALSDKMPLVTIKDGMVAVSCRKGTKSIRLRVLK
jgi:hypothetical protein